MEGITSFNVFGKIMCVRRQAEQWQLFTRNNSGLLSPVFDVVIPDELAEDQLLTFLDDQYHELATDHNPRVVKLT